MLLSKIIHNATLTANEKLMLIVISSYESRNASGLNEKQIPLEDLEKRTSLSRSTIKRVINDLVKNGYLTKRDLFDPMEGRQPSKYGLTTKLLEEYTGNVIQLRR